MEDDPYNGGTAISVEEKFYNIDNTKIILQTSLIGSPLPTHQNNNSVTNNNPYSNTGADSKRVYLLNATNNTVADKNGLGIVLKVMAGDAISIWGKSYHKKPGGADYTSSPNPLSVIDLMNMLAGSPAVSSKGISGTQISQLPGFLINVTTLLNNQPDQNPNRPRASINWIILDEQFKYVSSGFDMVETANATDWALKNHTIPNIAIPKNGYIYVYCSNESQYNVFFDNLQVVHDRGPILEETHYYPFGLTMAGISSEAAKEIAYPTNKYKYNGIEETKELGLSEYDAKLRILDPQIAVWWQVDPETENMEMWSPYTSNYDNPIRYEDKLGNTPQEACCPGALNLWQAVMQQAAANGPQLGKVIEVVGAVAVAAYALYELMPTQKEINAANAHNGALVGTPNIMVGNSYTMGTTSDGKSVPNPYGAKGKPDHQEKVKELEKQAQSETKPGETVLKERKIQGQDSNRKPDVQIVDKDGKARKVFEAERNPNSQRNQKREAEYKKLGLDQVTEKVGGN